MCSFWKSTFVGYHCITLRKGVDAFVKLKLYTLLGEEVAVLVDAPRSAGTHTIPFRLPVGLVSGTYVYRLRVGTEVASGVFIIHR
jgi:hypothetical protein